MVLVDVETVGVILTVSRACNTFRTEYVYRVKVVEGHTRFVVESGEDRKLHTSFRRILRAFFDVYDTQVVRIWTRDRYPATRRYYQLKRHCSPKFVGLQGHWKLWSER